MPTIGEQAEFYDQWNTRYRSDDFDQIEPEIRSRADKILSYLADSNASNERILEVGCGTGWLSRRLTRHGHVTAIDLSAKAIDIARSYDPDSEYIAADFLEHEFRGQTFSVVVCVETLFYVEDQQQFIAKLRDLCKPGGILAISTINKFVYSRSRDVLPAEPGQVRNWLSRKQTLALIGDYFDVDEHFTVEPRGDMGILRIVNSTKLNRLLSRLISPGRIKSLKERLGFGGGVVIFARRPAETM